MSISRPERAARATYHHGNLREALLVAARALIAEAGLDGFGLREVSRRAGVSHAAAYNHFASRSALVEALVIEAFAALAAALRGAEAVETEPILRLQNVGMAYVRFAYEHAPEFRFMFRPELCPPRELKDDEPLSVVPREAYGSLQNAIDACLADGSLEGDAETLALTAWSGVHGLASLIVDGPLRNEVHDVNAAVALARAVTATLCQRQRGPS